MLRSLYRCLLRLHPPAFRTRFADEMLSIFDQASGKKEALRLLLDGLQSLARQWTLRPEFWRDSSAPAPLSVPDGIPSFLSIDPFRPRTAAVIHGLALTAVVFCLTCFAIRYSWIHVLHVRIPEFQGASPRPMQSSGMAANQIEDQIEEVKTRPLDSLPQSPSPLLTAPDRAKATRRRAIATRAISQTLTGTATPAKGDARGGLIEKSHLEQAVTLVPQASHSTVLIASRPPQSYLGTYVSQSPERLIVSIRQQGGQLVVEIAGTPKGTLSPISETRFVVNGVGNCWIEFVPDGDGAIRRLNLFRNGHVVSAQRR